jgi:hypothetical protein
MNPSTHINTFDISHKAFEGFTRRASKSDAVPSNEERVLEREEHKDFFDLKIMSGENSQDPWYRTLSTAISKFHYSNFRDDLSEEDQAYVQKFMKHTNADKDWYVSGSRFLGVSLPKSDYDIMMSAMCIPERWEQISKIFTNYMKLDQDEGDFCIFKENMMVLPLRLPSGKKADLKLCLRHEFSVQAMKDRYWSNFVKSVPPFADTFFLWRGQMDLLKLPKADAQGFNTFSLFLIMVSAWIMAGFVKVLPPSDEKGLPLHEWNRRRPKARDMCNYATDLAMEVLTGECALDPQLGRLCERRSIPCKHAVLIMDYHSDCENSTCRSVTHKSSIVLYSMFICLRLNASCVADVSTYIHGRKVKTKLTNREPMSNEEGVIKSKMVDSNWKVITLKSEMKGATATYKAILTSDEGDVSHVGYGMSPKMARNNAMCQPEDLSLGPDVWDEKTLMMIKYIKKFHRERGGDPLDTAVKYGIKLKVHDGLLNAFKGEDLTVRKLNGIFRNKETVSSLYKVSSIDMRCRYCRGTAKTTCGNCKSARYCNRHCQAKDWKNHKKECLLRKELLETGGQ